jgi:hypothetical protein
MRADPGQVVLAEGGACDDPETILGEPRDGEVALNPAALVQHRRIGDRADVAGDLVVAEMFEEFGGALAGHFDLRERGLVEERGGLTGGLMLGPDRRRPQAPCPAAGAEGFVAGRRVGLEPVRPLPAGLLAESCAELLEARVGG